MTINYLNSDSGQVRPGVNTNLLVSFLFILSHRSFLFYTLQPFVLWVGTKDKENDLMVIKKITRGFEPWAGGLRRATCQYRG